jgi:hypothetical protein
MRSVYCNRIIPALAVICVLVLAITAKAQPSTHPQLRGSFDRQHLHSETVDFEHGFLITQVWDDLRYLGSEPDFLLVVAGLGVTPSVLSSTLGKEDPEITEAIGSSQFADNIFEVGEIVGDGAFPVAVSAAAWGSGKLLGSGRLSDFGSDLIRVQAINGIFTGLLKLGVNRKRPNGSAYSYPSGHTSSAFATAGVVYADFGPTYGIPAFALAGYIGISRLQEGKHYATDVVAGAVLGSMISLKLARRTERRGPLSVKPSKVADGYGLKFSYKF